MQRYGYNAHSKYDMKVHLVWIPKYRKRVLIGQIAVRVRELLRQVTMENEIQIISGKVAVDHIWGRHFWARGYLAVSSGTITDEVIQEYISIQEGEPLHDNDQFQID